MSTAVGSRLGRRYAPCPICKKNHSPWWNAEKGAWYLTLPTEEKGKYRKISLGDDHDKAIDRWHRIEAGLEVAALPTSTTDTILVGELVNHFLAAESTRLKPKRYKNTERFLRHFAEGFGAMSVAAMRVGGVPKIERWIDSHKKWCGCRADVVQRIRRLFNWSVENNLIPSSPVKSLKKPSYGIRVVLFGKNSRGLWDVIPFVWVCRRQVEERTAADFSYAAWERQGFLRVTDGSAQDQEEIGRQIEQIAATYPIRMTACDPVGLSWLSAKFQQLGINPWGFKQNMMVQAEPIKTLWRLVENKKLCHGGQPVLRWMASNIRAVTDGSDNIKFSKKHSEDKIDGMQALANAVGIALPAMVEEDFNTNASVYEERGLVLL